MDFELKVLSNKDWTSEFEVEWIQLFTRCYNVPQKKACEISKKYKLHASICCAMYVNKKLVGCYSGLVLMWHNNKIFLSTDTMSDGTVRNGTVKMATLLYSELAKTGFVLVAGFPNNQIRSIRRRKLGWIMNGDLYAWVGIPILRLLMRTQRENNLWSVNRPDSGFFGPKWRMLKLIGRTRSYGPIWGIPFTLSAEKPGYFYLKVPEWIISRKTFGYFILDDHQNAESLLCSDVSKLDLETIDLP